jgi:hydrogenase maturation protein HypF
MANIVERRRIRVIGTVQGVGYRPFVYREAASLRLAGFVRNDSSGVVIEVEGAPDDIDRLCVSLVRDAPALARVSAVETSTVMPRGDTAFVIDQSAAAGAPDVPVTVDSATCAACLAEVDDPTDRRYRYPFTNCTDCGPRYTIVQAVPYDRRATMMAAFTMCGRCQREYDDPADRRFHAQPNACPACGPRLQWSVTGASVSGVGEAAFDAATAALAGGGVIAVKGIGGFHLTTDATNGAAVAELRRRKARDEKPFAVMVPDVASAAQVCILDAGAEAELTSYRRPIVLAPRRPTAGLADDVAPGLPDLGVMLPYSPLHHLLLRALGRPLVMTSGNLSDEPIAHMDDDASRRLAGLVDGVLGHDRPIHIRCDDSVVRSMGAGIQVVRRSRGYAPEPLAMPWRASRQVLAVGAELKSTVSVAKGSMIVPSHHIGDLEHLANYEAFVQAVEHLCHLYGVEPDVVAHDLHPEYLSSKYAAELDLPALGVQHHHAHIASCLAEHGIGGPVLGVSFDGLGYGCDGGLWGGEFLLADLHGFERAGHLRPVALPGGAAAIREPWRMALSWLLTTAGVDAAAAFGENADPRYEAVIHLAQRPDVDATTSMGRLFDAVAALLGLRQRVTYEAQAAIELEAMARRVPRTAAPWFPVDIDRSGPLPMLDPASLLAAVMVATREGTPVPENAAAFHEGIGRGTTLLAAELASESGVDTVALSGGVFQNVRLTEIVRQGLEAQGLHVLTHHAVPPNDGGISVGQAAVAAYGSG